MMRIIISDIYFHSDEQFFTELSFEQTNEVKGGVGETAGIFDYDYGSNSSSSRQNPEDTRKQQANDILNQFSVDLNGVINRLRRQFSS